jgi:hypothetical protein
MQPKVLNLIKQKSSGIIGSKPDPAAALTPRKEKKT